MKSFKNFLGEGIDSPFLEKMKRARRIDAMSQYADDVEIEKEIESFYDDIKDELRSVKRGFERFLKKSTSRFRGKVRFEIKSDMKEVDSVVDKVVDRGKSLVGMNDLIRGAILFKDPQDALDYAERTVRKYSDKIVEYDVKERGGDSTYGYYGSIHLGILIDGLICELQVMSKKLWQYKSAAHDIYKKSRSSGGPTAGQQARSKRLFDLGNQSPVTESQEYPDIAFFVEELEEMDYDNWEDVDLDDDDYDESDQYDDDVHRYIDQDEIEDIVTRDHDIGNKMPTGTGY